MSGATSYHAGLAAEDGVARAYLDRGGLCAARRWRCAAGEIDLIIREGARVVFVEVKLAETLAEAAHRLGAPQIARIRMAASVFVAGEPAGQDTEMRFDLALVDGQGRIEIMPDAFGT